tara:strand:+ start:161 stop:751 length:591 start_codon:yes stop_codon:yes gene_type:complete
MFQFIPKLRDQVSPLIFSKIFNEEEIKNLDQIINSFDYTTGTFFDGSKEDKNTKIRDSKIKWIEPNEDNNWLFKKIEEHVLEANEKQFNFDLYNMPAAIQYTEYEGNIKGHYHWHMDLGTGNACYRKLSVTILLSDPSKVEGGNLEFYIGGRKADICQINQYDMVVFPSYLLHRVSPVIKGTRKSLVVWLGGSTLK